jgi:hypothetical protein
MLSLSKHAGMALTPYPLRQAQDDNTLINNLILCNRLMMRMTGFGTNKAGFGAAFAMVVIVFAAFIRTHTAYFLTYHQVLMTDNRISL